MAVEDMEMIVVAAVDMVGEDTEEEEDTVAVEMIVVVEEDMEEEEVSWENWAVMNPRLNFQCSSY